MEQGPVGKASTEHLMTSKAISRVTLKPRATTVKTQGEKQKLSRWPVTRERQPAKNWKSTE